jgi:hypothetical protein
MIWVFGLRPLVFVKAQDLRPKTKDLQDKDEI